MIELHLFSISECVQICIIFHKYYFLISVSWKPQFQCHYISSQIQLAVFRPAQLCNFISASICWHTTYRCAKGNYNHFCLVPPSQSPIYSLFCCCFLHVHVAHSILSILCLHTGINKPSSASLFRLKCIFVFVDNAELPFVWPSLACFPSSVAAESQLSGVPYNRNIHTHTTFL